MRQKFMSGSISPPSPHQPVHDGFRHPAFFKKQLERLRIGIGVPADFAGVNARRQKEEIHPQRGGAGKIGAKAVADRQHALKRNLASAQALRLRQRPLVDRPG